MLRGCAFDPGPTCGRQGRKRVNRLHTSTRLDGSPPAVQRSQEISLGYGVGARPDRADDVVCILVVVGEPHLSELAHVAVAQLASRELDEQAVVPMAVGLIARPDEIPCHAEVQNEDRSTGRAHQPLAMPDRLGEPATAQGPAQSLGSRVPKYVPARADAPYLLTGGVPLKESAIPLDVGKLRASMRADPSSRFRLPFDREAIKPSPRGVVSPPRAPRSQRKRRVTLVPSAPVTRSHRAGAAAEIVLDRIDQSDVGSPRRPHGSTTRLRRS
jgi:hypothetical protein